jgi:hypothetical protein
MMYNAETIQQIYGSMPYKWPSYIKHTIISADQLRFVLINTHPMQHAVNMLPNYVWLVTSPALHSINNSLM